MAIERLIREEEIEVIRFLLEVLELPHEEFAIAAEVTAYEDDVMRSIHLGRGEPQPYGGDLIRVTFEDADGIPVVITLTKDIHGKLLDLDFWKEDFSRLIRYPKPEELKPYQGL